MSTMIGSSDIPRKEIVARLKHEFVELLCLDPNSINEETRLVEDLDIDSLGMVDLVMQIEDCFDIVLPTNSDLSKIKTFSDVVDLVDKPRQSKLISTATS